MTEDKVVPIEANAKKEVNIVGFAPSTRDKAKFDDPNVEIWVLNEHYTTIKQASNITRWFELHQRETVLESKRSPDYIEHLKKSTIPVYMVKKYDDIPMSVEYPLQDIIAKLQTDYFTNSISYMIAMAVYEGYKKIGVYGVDMAQDEEYAKERPSVEYFIGWARASGCEVYIPPESDICKVPYLYGFEEASAHKMVTSIDPKRDDLQNRINNDDNMTDEMLEQIDYNLKKYMIDVPVDIKNNLPQEVQQIIGNLWTFSQNIRQYKKERLFLAGAHDMAAHLRKVLCPYD